MYEEAIRTGKEALEALEDAADSLDSAKRWGVVDILGGGLLTSVVKHSRLGDANHALTGARVALARFYDALGDCRGVAGIAALTAEVNRWNAFFDIACDNAIADILVQKEMSDAADRVDEAIDAVKRAVRRLEAARRG
jgi:hypothetical protein